MLSVLARATISQSLPSDDHQAEHVIQFPGTAVDQHQR